MGKGKGKGGKGREFALNWDCWMTMRGGGHCEMLAPHAVLEEEVEALAFLKEASDRLMIITHVWSHDVLGSHK